MDHLSSLPPETLAVLIGAALAVIGVSLLRREHARFQRGGLTAPVPRLFAMTVLAACGLILFAISLAVWMVG